MSEHKYVTEPITLHSVAGPWPIILLIAVTFQPIMLHITVGSQPIILDIEIKLHLVLNFSLEAWSQTRFTYRLPPRFLRAASIGAGRALTCLTGGGSCSLSSFCSISALRLSPTVPSWLSWQLSTLAASVDFADTNRAAFLRRS